MVLFYQLLALEDGLTHLDAQSLDFVASRNDTPIVVTKDENRFAV
jgi:hypothetical protein